MTIAQIKKNMKHGDYNILQKLLKLSTESAARQKFLRGDKDALEGMIKIQENRSIFCDLHADEDCSCHDDLKEAINQKAERNHSHDWNEITGKPTEFPPTHHSHNVRDIEGLDDVLHTIDDLRNLSNQKLDRDGSNATGSLSSTINNSHNHVNKAVLDTITSSKVNDWDNAASKAHNAVTLGSNATGLTITNQVLQFSSGYQLPTTIKVSEWDDAYLKRHTHGNKTVLDNLTQSVIDQAHVHSNKSVIDGITTQMVNNWNGSFVNNHTHNNKSTLDGISPADVTNWDTAHANNHTHANKVILDAITAAYTVAEKNKLATIQPNAQVNVKADWSATSGDAEILNKPTSFTPASHNHAISDVAGLQSELDSKLETPHLNGFVHDVAYNSSLHTLTFYQCNEPNIVIDLPIEHLIKGVQLHGNDLMFTFEDGSNVTIPMNTLLVGVVKSINGLAANSQGEVVLDITDIPGLQNVLNGKANTSGYYSGLQVGNSDNSTMWNNQSYDGNSVAGQINYSMVYDANLGLWKPATQGQVQTWLGITGSILNPTLQQVTNNGNTTTNPVAIKNTVIDDRQFFNPNPFYFLTDNGNAQQIATGGLLASYTYGDITKVPTYGIYSHGQITANTHVDVNGTLYVNKGIVLDDTSVLQDWSIYQDSVGINYYVTGGTYQGDVLRIGENGRLATLLDGDSSQWNQAYLATQNLSNNYVSKAGDVMSGTLQLSTPGQYLILQGHSLSGNYSTYRKYDGSKDIAYIGSDGGSAFGGGVGDRFGVRAVGDLLLGSDTGIIDAFSEIRAPYLKIGQTAGTGQGISLYDGNPNNPEYGLMFATTGNYGTMGSVNGDWATYFTMAGASNRGWIFRHQGIGNVASINGEGVISTMYHGNSGQWQSAWVNGLVNRGDIYTSNIDLNNLPIENRIAGIHTGNGSGNANFPDYMNGSYGIHTRTVGGAFTTDTVYGNGGEMWYKTWYHPSGANGTDWRKVWDNVNLSDPATETWVNNNFVSNVQLGQYLPLSGGTLTGGGVIDSQGNLILQQAPTMNATGMFWKNLADTNNICGIGSLTNGDILHEVYLGWGDYPWDRSSNFSVSINHIQYKGQDLWHDGNLADPATETWVNNNFASNTGLNNKANIDGSNTTGGINWDIQRILSSDLSGISGNGQVFYQSGNQIYWGNPLLTMHNFEMSNNNGLTVYSSQSGSTGQIWHQFNFDPSLKANYDGSNLTNIANWRSVLGVPTNNTQLTNGAGYITAGALSGYASQSWVNSQGFLTSASLPNVSNATITYQGTGAITGGGSHTINQSGNSTYNFDLTNQTKNEISLGVNAYNSLSSKQDTLVAGSGISIIGNTISATGSGGGGIVNIATDSSVMPGPTASQVPMYFNSHVAYGLPETDIANEFPGNLDVVVETGDTMRFYGSYDNVYTVTERTSGIVDLDIPGIRTHIYNVVFQSSGGTGGTVRFDRGIYTGDQINITVPRGQQITIQSSVSIVSPYGNGGGFECQTHANLIWDPKVDAWILVSYD
ncbi:hypothetical protein [Paenimyroides baculatum]|uniref:Uncharacterized protein n=1 Tax=Paenimyroides baculatum TaxID=2608000 RepID=A0A5M6CFJ4_9FLAO|nr:hypothetical protein [Paenimyroides baculatum]KAA5533901.1 hypothetical protein F0460_11240 [Paenimyroides baculatum]